MSLDSRFSKKILENLLAIIGSLGVLLPTSPINMPYPNRDSGVFLYIGWRILNGELPYRDIWDHKPPLVFYIDALGLAVTKYSRWGVWLIEFASLFFAITIFMKLMTKTIGFYPSTLSLILWLSTLTLIQGGNLTTEYTIPLQVNALYLIDEIDKPKFPKWRWFLMGLLSGTAFLLKQTSIGIWVTIIVYSFMQRLRVNQLKTYLNEILVFLCGVICIGIILFLNLIKNNIVTGYNST